MEPLACRLRPKSFDDIIGQDHLVGSNGVIRKMCENNKKHCNKNRYCCYSN